MPRKTKTAPADGDQIVAPHIVIGSTQLKLLQCAAVYLNLAILRGDVDEFLEDFFELVYLTIWPIERQKFFDDDFAEHGKQVLKKLVRKRLFWLRTMCTHVKPVVEWRKFIVLGVDKGEPWKEELARIRKALSRSGASRLVFVASQGNDEEEGDSDMEIPA